MTFIGGYQSDSNGGAGSNGAVFIADITPQASGNVGGKIFSSEGRVLDHCVTDTDLVTVHVIAITGGTNYKPLVTVEGNVVPLVEEEDRTLWSGSVNIDRNGATLLTALHEDGTRHYCTLDSDIGPTVTQALFSGGYPSIQTELKEDDVFLLQVVADSPMVAVEVQDFGAAKAATYPVPSGTSATVSITIANRGVVPQLLGCRVRCQNSNGSWGPFYETTVAGSDDGLHLVQLNNLRPVILLGSIDYPIGQLALKNAEVAMVHHSVVNSDTVAYDSPNNELNITNPFVLETTKSASRVSGTYNTDQANIRITAHRILNGATEQLSTTVVIAHAAPTLTVGLPASRLISGGNQGTTVQEHVLSIDSDQVLIGNPVISATGGTLLAIPLPDGASLQRWLQVLQVHDNDTKGSHSFSMVSGVNLAGVPASSTLIGAAYQLGGFVSRILPVPAFQHELVLGTSVSDISRLEARDKDQALLTYAANLVDSAKTFTITGPSGAQNPTGDLFHWLDSQAVANNTTGGATITLFEPA